MSRLMDYFVVVGLDHDKERAGKVLQRFPEYDWPETSFLPGIEMFCQPQGWQIHQSPKVPEFLLTVLTDVDAYQHYCACLTFAEAFIPTRFTDDEDENPATIPQVLYAPKSICIISRHEYFEIFKQCLGVIYTVYVNKLSVKMEVLIGNLLGFIQVPPPGGPQIRFSLGAGDQQYFQPPLLASVPISRDSIATFCQKLGISNVMLLLTAALIDSKILVYSSSYSELTNSCHALTTLCYPLKYSCVYVPILPAPLLEVLNCPTPFIMGIHSSLKGQVADLLDVIFIDLDRCQVQIPENITIPLPPEPIFTHIISSLKMVMDPSLFISNHAFPGTIRNSNRSLPEMLDKEIRAVFIQFFCEIFAGYRSCLTVVRIHPEPFVQFQKAQFLGMRGFVGDEFVTKVISSMSFGRFVHEFASPFRVMNIFDEMYAEHKLSMEPLDSDDMNLNRLNRIKEIAHRLYTNENPDTSTYTQELLRPSESAMMNPVPGYTFPKVDVRVVADIIQDGIAKQSQMSNWSSLRTPSSQVIPMGPNTLYLAKQVVAVNSASRLEVLSKCITHIFENRINDAKKLQPAVMKLLSNPSARLALSAELSRRVQSNHAMLEHPQFEMVVQLINCALQNDSVLDEYGVAASFLPLATAFCRKLCTGIIQFAYTRIQDHEIWANLDFWESAFYKDVQQDIAALYRPSLLTSDAPVIRNTQNLKNRDEKSVKVTASRSEKNLKALSTSLTASTALDIAADQIRSWNAHSAIQQKELIDREESTVFSQAIHYTNRIVYLRVPLDASSSSRVHQDNSMGTDTQTNSNFTNSIQESDTGNMSDQSGFQDEKKTFPESPESVKRFVTKFLDKICRESHVSEEHIRQLHQMIPGVVTMHIEGLEAVYRESKHLRPIPKPKITQPSPYYYYQNLLFVQEMAAFPASTENAVVYDIDEKAYINALKDYSKSLKEFLSERKEIIKTLEIICYDSSQRQKLLSIQRKLEKESVSLMMAHKRRCVELNVKLEQLRELRDKLASKNRGMNEEWLRHRLTVGEDSSSPKDEKEMIFNVAVNVATTIARSAPIRDTVVKVGVVTKSVVPLVKLTHVFVGVSIIADLASISWTARSMVKRKNRLELALQLQTEVLPGLFSELREFEQLAVMKTGNLSHNALII